MSNFVITGGSRGIGKEIVRQLAHEADCKVFYSYRSEPAFELEELPNIYSFKADNSKVTETKDFCNFILSNADSVDGLVNNVGVARFELLNNTQLSMWNDTHDTNVISTLLMYQFLREALISVKGTIVNIASIVHKHPSKGTGAYACSKYLMTQLSDQMAYENMGNGLNIVTISPGFILTEALQKPQYEKVRDQNLRKIPLGIFGVESDIARFVVFILSEKICIRPGSVIDITGGQHVYNC